MHPLRSNGWDKRRALRFCGRRLRNEALYPEDSLAQRLEKRKWKRAINQAKGFQGFQIFTHKHPGDPKLYGADPERNPNVKCIAVVRHGKEVLKSLLPYVNAHVDKFRNLWGGYPPQVKSPEEVLQFAIDYPSFYFEHVLAWWERRHLPNVLLLHYRDLRENPVQSIQRISDFLGIRADASAQGTGSASSSWCD